MNTTSLEDRKGGEKGRISNVRRFFARDTTYLRKDFNIRIRTEIVKSLVGQLDKSRVLDVGCGDGSVSRQFLNNANRVVMVDASRDMLELARAAAPKIGSFECEYIHTNFLEHTLTEKFDLVLCLGVLAHATSVDLMLRGIRTRLAETGRCVIQWSDSQRGAGKAMALYGMLREWAKPTYGYQLNRLRSSLVLDAAARSGLRAVSLTRYHLMLPGMGRLPNEVLYRFQRLTLSGRFLHALSSDVIGLFCADPLFSSEAIR